MKMNTVFHGKIYTEIIILVTGNTTLTRAKPNSRNSLHIREPGKHVQIMYMLFYDMIPG